MSNLDLYKTNGSSPPDTAALESQIQAEVAARRSVLNLARKTNLGHAREIGRLLVQLKDATEHGQWLPALGRCGLSERSAQRYMRLHDQTRHVADLPEPTTIREAEVAVATPKPRRDQSEEQAQADRRNARRAELKAGVQAPPDLIEKWRGAWASLNVTEAEVEEVERAVETWQESLRILYAARQRVLDVYPKRAPEIGPAEPMDGNLDGVGVAFRYLFETKGIGNGTLAVPTVSG